MEGGALKLQARRPHPERLREGTLGRGAHNARSIEYLSGRRCGPAQDLGRAKHIEDLSRSDDCISGLQIFRPLPASCVSINSTNVHVLICSRVHGIAVSPDSPRKWISETGHHYDARPAEFSSVSRSSF